MTSIQRTIARLVVLTTALAIPAGLVLGATAPAQACFFIAARGAAPSCGGGGDGAIFVVTATPSTTAVGDPITLTMTRTPAGLSPADVTASSTFSISSGSCAGRVCTPDALGTLTISGQYTGGTGGNAVTTVEVVAPDHLLVVPASDTATAGTTVPIGVFRAAADGTVLDDDSARATVTLGGAPCPDAVCTAGTAGLQAVTATDGALTGSAAVLVQAASASVIEVAPHAGPVWNGDEPATFTVEAYDVAHNDLGDVTPLSAFEIAPDGTCLGNTCYAPTRGTHTVTARYLGISATASAPAQGPLPAILGTLPNGQVGTAYSASVLRSSDPTARTTLAAGSTTPPGLSLSPEGILSGAPTHSGTFAFTVVAVNDGGTTSFTTVVYFAPAAGPSRPQVSAAGSSVREGNSGRTTVRVPIRLSAASSTPVTVAWHTANGTAVAGKDYVAAHGTVTIPAGQLTATIPVSVIGDKVQERNETFTVVLTTPNGATLGTARGIVTIANDD
jgi:hypothetical protein